MKNNLKALALTLGIMTVFAATNDASDMVGAQIMQAESMGEPTLTSIEATQNPDGTVTVNFVAENTTNYSLTGDIAESTESVNYSGKPISFALKNTGLNNVSLILANERTTQTVVMKFGETTDDLLRTEITKAFPDRTPEKLLQIVKNPLAFHVDAINAGEVPLDISDEHRFMLTVGKDESITIFGSMISPLRYSDTQITATLKDASSNINEVSATVSKDGSGLFSIELPKLTSGNYTISIESNDGKNFGPIFEIPMNVNRLLEATVPVETIKKFNWVLAGFMTFVILVSFYAYMIYRRKSAPAEVITVPNPIVTPGTV